MEPRRDVLDALDAVAWRPLAPQAPARVIAVTGGADFGKSVALNQWVRRSEDRAVLIDPFSALRGCIVYWIERLPPSKVVVIDQAGEVGNLGAAIGSARGRTVLLAVRTGDELSELAPQYRPAAHVLVRHWAEHAAQMGRAQPPSVPQWLSWVA